MVKVKTKVKKELKAPTLEELLKAGAHFGHLTRRWHPKMSPYIFAAKGKRHIFDLVKTKELLTGACNFLEEVALRGEKIIFVGTKRQAQPIVEAAAKESGALFVTRRWLGGTLTNFESIKKNIDRLKELEEGLKTGKFNHYTKRERLEIKRKILKLENLVGGIRELTQLPGALFLVDSRREKTALREANRCGIPVVALIDSNCDPSPVDYPIPGNDDAASAVEIIVKAVAKAVKSGYKGKPAEKEGGDLSSLGLSTRSLNALKKAGIETMEQLHALSEKDLDKIKGLGKKSVEEIMMACADVRSKK